MMDPRAVDEFKIRYDWFREFYTNLADLILAIDGQPELVGRYRISKDAPPFAPTDERKFYRFPDPISVSYDRAKEDEEHLAVPSFVSVLSAEALLTRKSIQPRALSLLRILNGLSAKEHLAEPTLVVFAHDPLPHKCPFTRKQDLDEKLVSGKRVFSGIMECEKKRGSSTCSPENKVKTKPRCGEIGRPDELERRFSFFLVPLDVFSEENCRTQKLDAVIGEEIVGPLKDLLDEFDRTKP